MNGTNEYLEAKVMTATPQQLHLMVVEGAIRKAEQAREALEREDIETAHFALADARAFVAELISGIDDGPDPELASNLKGLFVFVYKRLIDADRKRDPGLARDALAILHRHRETWIELGKRLTETGDADQDQSHPRLPHEPHTDPGAFDSPGRSWTT